MRSVGFSGENNRGIHWLDSAENDIIKQYPGKPKGGQFQGLLFSLILQPVYRNFVQRALDVKAVCRHLQNKMASKA